MKKSTKILLLIATITVVLGFAIIIATCLTVGKNELRDASKAIIGGADGSTSIYLADLLPEESVFLPENSIKSIEIDVDVAKILITTGENDAFHAKNTKSARILCELDDDGTLHIYDKRQKSWFLDSLFSINEVSAPIGTLVLASSINLESLDIDCDVGMVTIEDVLIETQELEVSVAVGNVEISDIKSYESDINVEVGSAKIEGELLGKNDIKCAVGKLTINVTGNIEDYSYEMQNNIGSITVNGNSSKGFGNLNAFDKNDITQVKKMNHFDLICDIGEIVVKITE